MGNTVYWVLFMVLNYTIFTIYFLMVSSLQQLIFILYNNLSNKMLYSEIIVSQTCPNIENSNNLSSK